MKKILNKLAELLADLLLESLSKKLDKMKTDIQKDIRKVDEECTKNFLVSFLKDVERGELIDDVERERFYEAYDHYTNELHLNSYIHQKVKKLEKEGKL